ncbi:MAG: single-stranded-DNA-specific exonuclease RecJ, partial [Planctomycetota bacterium]
MREVPEFVWRELVRRLGVTPLLARILAARGIRSEKEARDFLSPTLDALHDPFLFRDMGAAVERLFYAVAHGEPILIYGDYDAD